MNLQNEPTGSTWTISKRALNALCKHASPATAGRENLNQIHFDCAKGTIAATDGHRLLQAECIPNGKSELSLNIPADQLRAVVKATSARGGDVTIEIPHDGPITAGAFTLHASTIAFPPLEQVMPKDRTDTGNEGANVFGINAKLLADVALWAPKTKSNAVRIYPASSPLDPLVIKAEDFDEGINWYCVIMPVRL